MHTYWQTYFPFILLCQRAGVANNSSITSASKSISTLGAIAEGKFWLNWKAFVITSAAHLILPKRVNKYSGLCCYSLHLLMFKHWQKTILNKLALRYKASNAQKMHWIPITTIIYIILGRCWADQSQICAFRCIWQIVKTIRLYSVRAGVGDGEPLWRRIKQFIVSVPMQSEKY